MQIYSHAKLRTGVYALILMACLLIIIPACRTIEKPTVKKINGGKTLNMVAQVSVDSFFNMLTCNHQYEVHGNGIDSIYNDSVFAYFARYPYYYARPQLFKVRLDSLNTMFPNYKAFDKDKLKSMLWKYAVPEEYRKLWEYNTTIHRGNYAPNCKFETNKRRFDFMLVGQKVYLTLNWEIDCHYLERLKSKQYSVVYDLITKKAEVVP